MRDRAGTVDQSAASTAPGDKADWPGRMRLSRVWRSCTCADGSGGLHPTLPGPSPGPRRSTSQVELMRDAFTPDACVMARTLLGWNHDQLADLSGITLPTIR